LELEGYSPARVELHLYLLAHLSGWLEDRGLGAGDLTCEVVEEFVAARRVRRSWFRSPRSLAPLRRYLRSVGVEPAASMVGAPADGVGELLAAYRRYLVDSRGLAAATVEMYVRRAGLFVRAWWPDGVIAVGELDAAAIVGFVRREVEALSVASARCMLTALRSFLRFLQVAGLTGQPLVEAVPAVAVWRRRSIPRAVSEELTARLLGSPDTTTVIGRRDAAILTMLTRLGLRAGEVAGLCLQDIDWRAGEVVIRGKGRHVDRLPLPADVGEAVVAYLTGGRPQGASRAVFLAALAPYAPLSRCGVRSVVYHACDRVGVARVGPHRLRHTAGTRTLRAGASLPEVAQLLRQHTLQVTAVYATVDRAALDGLAGPWPGGAA
jgi:site-specific recombinase XerD